MGSANLSSGWLLCVDRWHGDCGGGDGYGVLQVGSGFDLDGRRALVAYRRYLMFLLWFRMSRREDVGEQGGPLSVRYVATELDSLEFIIRRDASAFLAGPEEVWSGETCDESLRFFSMGVCVTAQCAGVSRGGGCCMHSPCVEACPAWFFFGKPCFAAQASVRRASG